MTRIGVLAAAAVLVASALLFAVVLPGKSGLPTPGARLTSATNFGISGSVSGLAPGVGSTLTLTATNPYSVAITLTSVSVSVSTVPTGCPVANLTLNGSTFGGSPPSVTLSGLSQSVPAHGSTNLLVPIALARTAPNGCQVVTFPFGYSGTASYTATTQTVLVSSPNPSSFGQTVTLTATVSSSVAPDPGSPPPSGSVTFYVCATSACSSTFAISGPTSLDSSGKATFSATALLLGTHYIVAKFTPADATSFAASTSNVVTQVVKTPLACITLKNGGLVVANGQSVCVTGVVNGGVTVQRGGALFVSASIINGGITATGATAFEVCASTVNGALNVSASTGFVEIGDGADDGFPPCLGNIVTSGITLSGNSAGYEVGGNTASTSSAVSSNIGTGPTVEDKTPEIEGNHFSSLSCSGNVPAPVDGGQVNTGTKSGQCAGAGF
ncbi:MAG: Ig-like domain-containing protein [Candidatus Dormibacteria bacterium]